MRLLLQLLVNGLVNGAVYVMLAIGFGLVWRALRVFHVAYGGLFVASAYCFHTLTARAGIPVTVALLLTMGFAAVLGWICEMILYRPLARKNASGGAALIASLGVYIVIENAISLIFGNRLQTVPRDVAQTYHFQGVTLTDIQMVQFAIGAVVAGTLWVLARRMRTFKALWAMGDQPELLPVLGLPVNRLRTLVLVLSTALVALPASLICLDNGTDPHVGMSYLLIAVVAVLIGGNSYAGWISGAMVLALLQSFVVWSFSSRWMDLVTFALLVIMLVFRPSGLVDPNKGIEEPT